MKERLKELRNALNLTQQEFADKIGIQRGTYAKYEVGRNNPIDAVIRLMCQTFNVSETWLRTGTGEMFLETKYDTAAKFAAENGLNHTEEVIVREYLNLDPKDREIFRKFLRNVLSDLGVQDISTSHPESDDIDFKVESYKAELEAEAASKKSEASHDTNVQDA